jgi:hypothetical protein
VPFEAAARGAREAIAAPSTDVPMPFQNARTDPLKCAESIDHEPTTMVNFTAAILRRVQALTGKPANVLDIDPVRTRQRP